VGEIQQRKTLQAKAFQATVLLVEVRGVAPVQARGPIPLCER